MFKSPKEFGIMIIFGESLCIEINNLSLSHAKVDDMIINQLARGFSPSQAANLPDSYHESKPWKLELQKLRDEFLPKNEFYEEIKLYRGSDDAPSKPLPAPPLPVSRPPSVLSAATGATVATSPGVSTEWKQYVKSTLKQYVSASDIHGLITEVQRISESHKTLMNEKSDFKLKLDSIEHRFDNSGIPSVPIRNQSLSLPRSAAEIKKLADNDTDALAQQIRSVKDQLNVLETRLEPEKLLWTKQSEEISNLCDKISALTTENTKILEKLKMFEDNQSSKTPVIKLATEEMTLESGALGESLGELERTLRQLEGREPEMKETLASDSSSTNKDLELVIRNFEVLKQKMEIDSTKLNHLIINQAKMDSISEKVNKLESDFKFMSDATHDPFAEKSENSETNFSEIELERLKNEVNENLKQKFEEFKFKNTTEAASQYKKFELTIGNLKVGLD